jgi:hypothetical protein
MCVGLAKASCILILAVHARQKTLTQVFGVYYMGVDVSYLACSMYVPAPHVQRGLGTSLPFRNLLHRARHSELGTHLRVTLL